MDLIACPKLRRRMKLVLFLLLTCTLYASAKGHSQTITLSVKNRPIEEVFKQITAQSGYLFFYNAEQLKTAKPVSLALKNATLEIALQKCFSDQPLTFAIINKTIVVKTKSSLPVEQSPNTGEELKGKVMSENGTPAAGVTVKIKNTNIFTTTDETGNFTIKNIKNGDILVISGAEILTQEIIIHTGEFLSIVVKAKVGQLDQVIMMAYGQTTRRVNTGNISRVDATEIERQPVSNPLAALQGRVPGLIINQANGYANSPFSVQIRGRNSILQNSQPLFIVDGVPFAAQNDPINQVNSASNAGTNPFYTINPQDIESIEILKDADATAIYGSRGANGVILLTTKKGKNGKTKVDLNTYTGWSRATRTMPMLDTRSYVQMRREAFENDGIIPDVNNAADIELWDTTRYNNLKDFFIGGTAVTNDINLSVSGGAPGTQFLISGGYHRESTVLPVSLSDHRLSLHSSINHESANKKFRANLSSNYSYTKNRLPGIDPTTFINRPPNMLLYDSVHNLNWQEEGVPFGYISSGYANPLAALETEYAGELKNFSGSLQLSYRLFNNLNVLANLGYNSISTDETNTNPQSSIDPFSGWLPSANFGTGSNQTWIVEPQLEYNKKTSIGKFSILAGATMQKKTTSGISATGLDYQNDFLLHTISGAAMIITSNNYSEYRYAALFGRINYNWQDRYIINLTGRRDGSSRFGPAKQFNNFGALGAAWIFSKENVVTEHLPWLSFGKIRGSIGITGSDGIGNYQFLDAWNSSTTSYQGIPVITPTALYNPDLAWENNRKFEIGLEIGLFKQRLFATINYFRNRSGNQLVFYNLPIQAGFPGVNKNRDALVQNSGVEIDLESRNIQSGEFTWQTRLNLTFNRNKLLRFPGLANSSYANSLVIGKPLSVKKLLDFEGVDPLTGTYKMKDVDGNGLLTIADRIIVANTDPRYYGGFENTFTYAGFELNVLFQFTKQTGINYLGTVAGYTPGSAYTNQPAIVLNRWQKPGDHSNIQKFTTNISAEGAQLVNSTGAYSDASFIRCKNISLTYSFAPAVLKKIKIERLKIYANAQNLFTITNYLGADPETQNMFRMPPLRTVVVGFSLTF
ncbi:MAG: SusC/RagA family TonB-linked outer membrane protein [Chitinophagaceae bacterium]|nr:MAG: SusC/RagA family TonB-linked outer membrane protein [Chitinophagaceae bacterium]